MRTLQKRFRSRRRAWPGLIAVAAVLVMRPQPATAATSPALGASAAPPAQPVRHPSSSEKPPRLFGYVQTSMRFRLIRTYLMAGVITAVANLCPSMPHGTAFAPLRPVAAQAQVDVRSHPLKSVPKPPKADDPAAAVDCMGKGFDTLMTRPPRTKAEKAVARYMTILRQFIPVFEAKLRHPLGIMVCMNRPKKYSGDPIDGAKAKVLDAEGTGATSAAACWIEINPTGFLMNSPQNLRTGLAHELFHCFQGVLVNKPVQFWLHHEWIKEGQAEWAAATVAGPDNVTTDWWREYLNAPTVALADIPPKDGYREIGFYAHLKESGINPWEVIQPMLEASSDADAFHTADYAQGDAAAKRFLDTWGSSFFQHAGWSRAWRTSGPGLPSGVAGHPEALSVVNGGSVKKKAQPYTLGLFHLESTPDVLTVVASGHVRISDGAVDDILDGGSGKYCVRSDGCDCPAGFQYTGPTLKVLHPGSIDLALTGGEDGTSVELDGDSLDHFCSRSDPCLVGAWNLADPSAYWKWLVIQGRAPGDAATFVGAEGTESMTFRKDGTAELDADNYVLTFEGPHGEIIQDVQSGKLTAQWSTSAVGTAELIINPDDSQWTNDLVAGTFSEPVTLLATPWFRTVTPTEPQLTPSGPYECSSSALRWWMTVSKGSPPVIFTRENS